MKITPTLNLGGQCREAIRAYAALEAGSTAIYPIGATPYSACRVVFVDRFGIRWGLITEQKA